MKRFALFALLIGLVAAPLLAQMPTGTVSGHATDGKDPLPGVTVSATSPNLQGTRSSVTNGNGDYILAFLPPGDYRVTFELQGFQTIETTVKVNAAQTQKVNATMPQAKVAEEVTVTGAYETVQSSGTAATTYEKSLINKLPVAKTINQAALLVAGVEQNAGASNAVTIAGAVSYENLFMINGVAVMDNVRGTATNLYIEDAVQETTTSVSDVSAEYGRFTGGVINMLTKSGGNEFHGSYRDTLTSDKWTALSPLQTAQRSSAVNQQHELTLGGFLWKDHIWFFGAFRELNTRGSAQTFTTDIPYTTGSNEKRYEGKLTLSPTPNHRLVYDYIKIDHSDLGYGFNPSGFAFFDLASTYTRELPQNLTAVNYTGVLTDNFFVEGQYSEKHFTFVNSGSPYSDLERGTPLADTNNFGLYAMYNSPVFGAISPERRDNKDYLAKASWFLSTASLGSHDIVAGYDQFEDMRSANNYQSGSSWWLYPDTEVGLGVPNVPTIPTLPGGTPYPVFIPDSGSSYVFWAPIFQLTSGNDFKTESVFVNDKWRLNNNFSFNIGLRYDKNHGVNSSGAETAKDSAVSPRLSATYDPTGDGTWQFNASYAKYVAGISNTAGDASAAGGQPASIYYNYATPASGIAPPAINTGASCNTTTGQGCLTPHQAIDAVFNWFNNLSQADKNSLLSYASIPGLNVQILNSVKSPNVDEYTIGFSKRLGNNGNVRVDYVNRNYKDFYIYASEYGAGGVPKTVSDQYGNVYDMSNLQNTSNILTRKYNGIHVSASYRLSDAINLGGNYTWSTLKGNFNGESGGSGPTPGNTLQYPEYKAFAQYNPSGYLAADQRQRLRVYGVWDILNTKHNRLSFSLMESYLSAPDISAVGNITIRPYVTNPGYTSPPTSVSYFFSPRGAYRLDATTSTDIALTYAFVLPVFGSDLQFYLEPRITNLFNEHAVNYPAAVGTTVYTSRNAGHGLVAFNPFTTKPIECPQGDKANQCAALGANYQLAANFGQPLAPTTSTTQGAYQLPRTIILSLGVRF
jgi:outer membrane receptor protein involved in Fe transport